ncbi:ABC transporter permease [Coraliomargarita sp. SDUM461003]|uniref:ABC transporter permease n=2 Tax=Thalassobacterium maritimum TaxID=3041265 RepID=A0ABU1AQJ7_9BACT|nr:ABC transporter permease [Coraliomargarita sp. SDUM461003]MDQ8206441.1 ABC transporter permease [Coraliomargarita sp. SDUM461003]
MISMLTNAFFIALREIKRNLMRAFLTVLGIIIGVAAVITMVTLGDGTTQAVKDNISNLGSNLVMVRPGSGFGPRSSSAGVPNFTEADVTAIAEQVPGVAAIAPVRNSSLSTIYRQEARSTSVTGSTLDYFEINSWELAEGRYFTTTEAKTGAAVAVIGNTVKTELFDDEDPIGQKIRVGQASLQIIGILKAKGQAGMGDQDDTMVVPLTTMQRRLGGRSSGRDISQISISAEDDFDSDLLISNITSLMRQRRNLQSNQDNDFNVFDTRQIAETLSSSTQLMTTLLAAVAAVSLLVGGIGIMNIMLVSVTERTREIGIRLAIGATAREVLWQFLVEALTLSCVGGIVGITLAYIFCSLIAPLIQIGFVFNTQINLIAFAFSALVGIVFGFAPARRAAKLDPIDALRHE